MRTTRRYLVVLCALATLLTMSTGSAAAAEATQAPSLEGRFEFSGLDTERYFEMSDGHGTFTGQTSYVDQSSPEFGQSVTMAWSYRVSPDLQAIATTPMNCATDVDQVRNYHDYHPNVPVDYFLHSSIRGLGFSQPYDLRGQCVFGVQVDGYPGTATLRYAFHFTVADGLPETP